MNPAIQRWGVALAVVLVTTAGAVAAQAPPSLAPQTSSSGIDYVTGGVGKAQQDAMANMKPDYTLRLTFAREKTGEFLADVKVQIDQEGRQPFNAPVLNVTAGPMLFAKLPDGEYRVRAETAGQVQSKTLTIRQGSAKEFGLLLSRIDLSIVAARRLVCRRDCDVDQVSMLTKEVHRRHPGLAGRSWHAGDSWPWAACRCRSHRRCTRSTPTGSRRPSAFSRSAALNTSMLRAKLSVALTAGLEPPLLRRGGGGLPCGAPVPKFATMR